MSGTKTRMRWTPELMRIYQKFPAAFKSANWEKIVALVADGKIKDAEFLAGDHEDRHKSNRAQNVIARRLRLQRVTLFKIQREHLEKITVEFKNTAMAISNRMIQLPNSISSIAPMRRFTRASIVILRRNLNVIVSDLIWQSILLGVKNMGEAIKPILRDNSEAFAGELADVLLIEERLTMGVSRRLAGRTAGTVDLNSEKWQKILDDIYARIVKSNNNGLTLSERIWDVTGRAEADLKRILAGEIAKGTSSRDIADRIQRYVYTSGVDEDYQAGPGVYRSPLKNVLRVARTETNRAYTQATAAWADNKPWVKAISVTLSPAHDKEDECDDVAGNEYSPDEFADVIPVHPHCMCFGTYVIDENYLTGDQSDDAAPDEEAA